MYTCKTTFKQLKPFSLGFNDLFDFAENFNFELDDSAFPKYNILKPTESTWIIELALAGYSKQDIDIEHKDGVLTISHIKPKQPNDIKPHKVLHQGITKKSFSKQFAIADSILVKNADFTDGLLRIDLEEPTPEIKKSTKIQIN